MLTGKQTAFSRLVHDVHSALVSKVTDKCEVYLRQMDYIRDEDIHTKAHRYLRP